MADKRCGQCSVGAAAGTERGGQPREVQCCLRGSIPFTSFSLTFGKLTTKFELLFQFRKAESYRPFRGCLRKSSLFTSFSLTFGKLTTKFEMLFQFRKAESRRRTSIHVLLFAETTRNSDIPPLTSSIAPKTRRISSGSVTDASAEPPYAPSIPTELVSNMSG